MTITNDVADTLLNGAVSECSTPSGSRGGGREVAASVSRGPRGHSSASQERRLAGERFFARAARLLLQQLRTPTALKSIALGLGICALTAVGFAATLADPHQDGVEQSLSGPRNSPAQGPMPAGISPRDSAARTDAGSALASSDARAAGKPPSAEKIVLNLASADELTKLPGVGPKRAAAIVELRARLRGFKHVNDLLRVRGIGRKGLQRIAPYVVIDAPAGDGDAGRAGPAKPH